LLIPGERFNRKIVDYLRFTREFNAAFPGFDTDVHGLVEDDSVPGTRSYYVDCVKPDNPAPTVVVADAPGSTQAAGHRRRQQLIQPVRSPGLPMA
jgi:hypothetical protein